MYHGVGQATGCLGQSWMQLAMACDYPDTAPKELVPTAGMCKPYYDEKSRLAWDAQPLCDDLKPIPAGMCGDKEWAREAAEDLSYCIEDPYSHARCAVALHPGTISELNQVCPGIYTTAAEMARSRRSMRTALAVGAVVSAVGLGVYWWRKR
jgi:hypothetical protein